MVKHYVCWKLFADDTELYCALHPDPASAPIAVHTVEECHLAVKAWMTANKLNNEKNWSYHLWFQSQSTKGLCKLDPHRIVSDSSLKHCQRSKVFSWWMPVDDKSHTFNCNIIAGSCVFYPCCLDKPHQWTWTEKLQICNGCVTCPVKVGLLTATVVRGAY